MRSCHYPVTVPYLFVICNGFSVGKPAKVTSTGTANSTGHKKAKLFFETAIKYLKIA